MSDKKQIQEVERPPLCPFMSRPFVMLGSPAALSGSGKLVGMPGALPPEPVQVFAPVACQGSACALWRRQGRASIGVLQSGYCALRGKDDE